MKDHLGRSTPEQWMCKEQTVIGGLKYCCHGSSEKGLGHGHLQPDALCLRCPNTSSEAHHGRGVTQNLPYLYIIACWGRMRRGPLWERAQTWSAKLLIGKQQQPTRQQSWDPWSTHHPLLGPHRWEHSLGPQGWGHSLGHNINQQQPRSDGS